MAGDNEKTLVVGAGPTGSSAALFLSHQGQSVRIVEKATEPSQYSRAFAVNPRTLTLLEHTGVTERMLGEGWKLTAANIYRNHRRIFRNELGRVSARFPFMLILSQARSEALLHQALSECGVAVERGVALESLTEKDGKVEAILRHPEGTLESAWFGRVLGADGARSTVRKETNVNFPGSLYPEPWHLADVELEVPLDPHEAHLFLFDDGGIILLRIYGNVWRTAGRVENAVERLPAGTKAGKVVWSSNFNIAHRVVDRFSIGNVFLAGDAAHLHSPVGGRGMNLGIEDGYVFAQLAKADRLKDYHRARHRIVRRVVRQVARITEMPRGISIPSRVARRLWPLASVIGPLVARNGARFVLGLDHEVKY